MTPEDVLRDHRSEIPSWLFSRPPLSAETLEQFLSSRVVYYPGSGADGHAVQLFGGTHAAHCFVHADFGRSAESVQSLLAPANPRHFRGYQACVQQVLSATELLRLIEADSAHPCPGQDTRLTGALWAVLEREPDMNDDHGPLLIAFLHIGAEAVWVFDKLWARARRAPYAVLLQDHWWAGNWRPFGGDQAPLYRLARNCNALPPWLVIAENTEAWPRYMAASDFSDPRGERGHRRRLFSLPCSPPVGQPTRARDLDH